MQINRLSLGLQEQLKTISNFNTARNENLFKYQIAEAKDENKTNEEIKELSFGQLDAKDLGITGKQIQNLLGDFSEEIIKVFSGDISLDNPLRDNNNQGRQIFMA